VSKIVLRKFPAETNWHIPCLPTASRDVKIFADAVVLRTRVVSVLTITNEEPPLNYYI